MSCRFVYDSFTYLEVREAQLRRHRHLYEKNKDNSAAKLPIIRSLADIGRNYSTSRSKWLAIITTRITKLTPQKLNSFK